MRDGSITEGKSCLAMLFNPWALNESILSNSASLGWQNLLTIHKEFFLDLIYEFCDYLRKLDKDKDRN